MTAPVVIDDAVLFRAYDTTRQTEFSRLALTAMGYDFSRGRLDLSAHPFTTSFHPTDVRLTTRVSRMSRPPASSALSMRAVTVSTTRGLTRERYGTPSGHALSLGIHESQSRLWENCVWAISAFLEMLRPSQGIFSPSNCPTLRWGVFTAAINRVKPFLPYPRRGG